MNKKQFRDPSSSTCQVKEKYTRMYSSRIRVNPHPQRGHPAMHGPLRCTPLPCMPPPLSPPPPHKSPCHTCPPHYACQPPPVDIILDTRLWKHYLSATLFAEGKNSMIPSSGIGLPLWEILNSPLKFDREIRVFWFMILLKNETGINQMETLQPHSRCWFSFPNTLDFFFKRRQYLMSLLHETLILLYLFSCWWQKRKVVDCFLSCSDSKMI